MSLSASSNLDITQIADIIDALQKAKADLIEASENPLENESYLGMMAILSDECADFHQLYEEEALKHPKLDGVAW